MLAGLHYIVANKTGQVEKNKLTPQGQFNPSSVSAQSENVRPALKWAQRNSYDRSRRGRVFVPPVVGRQMVTEGSVGPRAVRDTVLVLSVPHPHEGRTGNGEITILHIL